MDRNKYAALIAALSDRMGCTVLYSTHTDEHGTTRAAIKLVNSLSDGTVYGAYYVVRTYDAGTDHESRRMGLLYAYRGATRWEQIPGEQRALTIMSRQAIAQNRAMLAIIDARAELDAQEARPTARPAYRKGERPAMRVIEPAFTGPREGWELVQENTRTAYLRHPGIVGTLPFPLVHVERVEARPTHSPLPNRGQGPEGATPYTAYTHHAGEPFTLYDGLRVDIDGEEWCYSDTDGWQCALYPEHVTLMDAIDGYDFIELTTKGN